MIGGLLNYLKEIQLYEDLLLDGNRYVLVHIDIAGNVKDRPLDQYGIEDLIFTRAEILTIWLQDILQHSKSAQDIMGKYIEKIVILQ